MIVAALRDLVWRRKRFAIAVAATALVFGMSLLMSGLAESFPSEIHSFVDRLGGREYIASAGEPGPFTTTKVALAAAVPDAAPLIFTQTALHIGTRFKSLSIVGLPPGYDVGVRDGRGARQAGEVVADSSLGKRVGDVLTLGGHREVVVGRTHGATLFGGQPIVFVTVADAQAVLAAGAPITRAWIADRDVAIGPGLERFTRAQAREDLLRPLGSATSAIVFVKLLLWIVAACIVGSVVFLSALERMRDFAVFKATGVSTRSIAIALSLQAVVVAIVASAFAVLVAIVLAPTFPMPIVVPVSAYIALPALAVAIGLVASLAGLRRVVAVDPAAAFGGR